MYKPEFRIIHIISSIMNFNRNIDHNTKHKIMTSLNTYAIDTIAQNEAIQNKLNELEYEINTIKEFINIKELKKNKNDD